MSSRRVVFDCNTLLQALVSTSGPAGRCTEMVLKGEMELFLSAVVISELRDVAARPKVARKLKLNSEKVDAFVQVLAQVATFLSVVPEIFSYPRDPDDAHYVNLALAANASLIVSRDQDLLDLMDPATDEGQNFRTRFPTLRIVTPVQFLQDAQPDTQA